MSDNRKTLTDTRDMRGVHQAFRRAFDDAPGQLALVRNGDVERALFLADYLGEVFWLLHAHHVAEEELLYPLLVERVPDEQELFSRMDAQHLSLVSAIEACSHAAQRFGTSGSAADGGALATACRSLAAPLSEHLADEEEQVLPLAARGVSPPEWAALPAHAMSQYPGDRVWLLSGLALEAMPDDVSWELLGHLPPPLSEMWFGGGADAFGKEMAKVRGAA